MERLLHVRDLTVHYQRGHAEGRPAVDGISFDVDAGEVVGVMGESGCGKTTIAMAVLGLLPRSQAVISGSIQLQGQELLSMSEPELQKIRGERISLVYQEPAIALSPVMRVGDQIAEVIRAHKESDWNRCRARAEAMMALVGFSEKDRIYSAYPHQLSGGQRQRILLAQALACEPQLVIADEPTAALDACSQAEFLSLLRDLKRRRQASFLLISHTAEVQASLADRLLVMSEGRIVEQGKFEQVYANPSHPCTKAMLRKNRARRRDASFESETAIPEFLAP